MRGRKPGDPRERPCVVEGGSPAAGPRGARALPGWAVDLFAAGDLGGPCLCRLGCAAAAAEVLELNIACLAERPAYARRRFGATLERGSCLELSPGPSLPFGQGRGAHAGGGGRSPLRSCSVCKMAPSSHRPSPEPSRRPLTRVCPPPP
jgi:hypothetical protein